MAMEQDDRIRSCSDLDERLAPYVDDEIAPAARQAADAHMTGCPPCRMRMESERVARDVIREHRAELRGAAPAELHARCLAARNLSAGPSRLRRWVPLSLAATLVLAVGAVFVLGLNDGAEALAAGLTLDHVKCFKVTKPDGAIPIDADRAGHKWQEMQGWTLTIPTTAPDESLRLIDVRRCLSTDGRAAHLMYLWHGEPLSVYVLPRAVSRQRVLDSMGHQTAIWSANGRTYAVLATGHPDGFDHIVGYVKTHAR
jgi:anti-sigma factor RsiW